MSETFFDESVILIDVDANKKEEVLKLMAQNLVSKNLVKESFIQAIIKRENEFATGLPTAGVSVAIPHTDVEHVNQKSISVAILKNPVDFIVMGDDSKSTPVQIVFMLAMDDEGSQLELLQKLMQVFQEEETLKELVNQSRASNIKSILDEKLDLVVFKGGEN